MVGIGAKWTRAFLWQYPEGYLEAQKEKEEAAAKEEKDGNQNSSPKTPKDKTKKRKRSLDAEVEVRCGSLSIILSFFLTSTEQIRDIYFEKCK